MRRLLAITTIDQVKALGADAVALTVPERSANVPPGTRRDAPEVSAFWPELNPQTSQTMIERGYGEQVDLARAQYAEIDAASVAAGIDKGWAVPIGLRQRAIFEVGAVLMSSKSAKERLGAAAILERMVRASNNPNTLPSQLSPDGSTAGAVNVQVNVQNNMPPSEPTASVAEVVDEILGRADVQAALDADVPNPGYDYGM